MSLEDIFRMFQSEGLPLKMDTRIPNFDSPSRGEPLNLRMAPGLYTSGQNGTMQLPIMPAWLQKYILDNQLNQRVPGTPLISQGQIRSGPIKFE
jgi:hypothetical protein